MLHLVKDSPFSHNSLALCLSYINQQDVILLLENAVVAAIDGQIWQKKLQQASVTVFALQEDVEARALGASIASSVELIDTSGFVDLTEKYENILSW